MDNREPYLEGFKCGLYDEERINPCFPTTNEYDEFYYWEIGFDAGKEKAYLLRQGSY